MPLSWLRARGCWLLALGALSLLSLPVFAHDLTIDQLVIWPDLDRSTLRAEITFDPELTRARGEPDSAAARKRVVEFLQQNLSFELDGQALSVLYEVRELWLAGGAVAGDLVRVTGRLPLGARVLRVGTGASFKALVVSVERSDPQQRIAAQSWLLTAGTHTPEYQLIPGGHNEGWLPGGASRFQDAARQKPAPDPSSTARRAATTTGDGDRANLLQPAAEANDTGRAEHGGWSGGARFALLGFHHILPEGTDHVLFVAGLVLGSLRDWRRIVIELSLFTVAHTLTLGLSTLGLVALSPRLVEPLIAWSICYVGIENLWRQRESSLRYALVVVFGLAHGLGFAGALSSTPLSRDALLVPLFAFNVGVEIGQLAVVVLVLLLVGVFSVLLEVVRRLRRGRAESGPAAGLTMAQSLRRYVINPCSCIIAAFGFYWGVERLMG